MKELSFCSNIYNSAYLLGVIVYSYVVFVLMNLFLGGASLIEPCSCCLYSFGLCYLLLYENIKKFFSWFIISSFIYLLDIIPQGLPIVSVWIIGHFPPCPS